VDDDHRRVRRLGDAQQPRDRLGLEIVGPCLGVGGNVRRASGGLELGNARVDHTGVLAVDARDAAALFQRLERGIHRAVANHHGGVGEVHLKGRDACGEHIVQLALDALVPVVDGHVEAVVARAFAVGLFVPETKTVGKRLALVHAEIDVRKFILRSVRIAERNVFELHCAVLFAFAHAALADVCLALEHLVDTLGRDLRLRQQH